jgi:hypothetical protein
MPTSVVPVGTSFKRWSRSLVQPLWRLLEELRGLVRCLLGDVPRGTTSSRHRWRLQEALARLVRPLLNVVPRGTTSTLLPRSLGESRFYDVP